MHDVRLRRPEMNVQYHHGDAYTGETGESEVFNQALCINETSGMGWPWLMKA